MSQTTTPVERNLPLVYIETTIPAGVTIAEYRRSRASRRPRWHRFRRRAGR